MTHKISDQSTGTKKPRSRRTLVTMIAACGLILSAGITVVSVTAAKASAKETTRLCAVALNESAAASKAALTSTADADKTLETVKRTKLRTRPGTSTAYEMRPAVKAAQTVPARASGADFIGDVTRSKAALVGITIPTQCTDRRHADAISSATVKHSKAAKALDTSVEALLADFTVFQTDETRRIAAEKKAADEKAAAAEKKAEADAAKAERVAAEEAAVASQAQEVPQYVDPEPAAGGGGHVPAPAPYVQAPAPAPGGGVSSGGGSSPNRTAPNGGSFDVGLGDPGSGVCWTSNGMGGTMRCP